MEELLEKYKELNTAHQQELLAFVDKLLLKERLKKTAGDLTEYKKRISKVSVWSDEHLGQMEEDIKTFGYLPHPLQYLNC